MLSRWSVVAFAAAGMVVAGARADGSNSWIGDYAGWGYQTAEAGGSDLPLRLHIRAGDAGADLAIALDVPSSEAYGVPIQDVQVDGPRLVLRRLNSKGVPWVIVLTREGEDFRGQLEIGEATVYRLQLHRSALPLAAPRAEQADAVGCYRFEDGALLWLTRRPWGELEYYDSRSARQGTLFELGDDRYFAGAAAYVPSHQDAEVTIPAPADGRPVAEVIWTPTGGTPARARRVEIVEREVEARSGDITLHGTLLVPPTSKPVGAVVLIGGSDWAVRASTRADARLFVSMGMAALVYDRRGCGASTGEELCTFAQSADDALAMAAAAREQPGIRRDAVGLAGRSRGGWTAPLAGARGDPAFVIMLSGAAISPLETQVSNRINRMREAGLNEACLAEGRRYLDLLWNSDSSDAAWAEYAAARERMIDRDWWKYLWGPDTRDSGVYRWQLLNYRYDPREALGRVRCPLLAVYGEYDDNIMPAENIPALRAATSKLAPDQVTIVVLAGADHGLRANESDPLRRGRWHLSKGWDPALPDTLRGWLVQRGLAAGKIEPD